MGAQLDHATFIPSVESRNHLDLARPHRWPLLGGGSLFPPKGL